MTIHTPTQFIRFDPDWLHLVKIEPAGDGYKRRNPPSVLVVIISPVESFSMSMFGPMTTTPNRRDAYRIEGAEGIDVLNQLEEQGLLPNARSMVDQFVGYLANEERRDA